MQAHNVQIPTNELTESEQRRIRRSAYRWNMSAGLLFSFQSVIMLVVLTRVCDVATAGVFTIAFAVANLFMNMGNYGMRKFQASDRLREFGFREYRASRIATCVAMLLCSGAYIAWTSVTLQYSGYKTAVIVVMCLFKALDAFEDVYSGAYQQQDRLDVGARMTSIRQVFSIALFSLAIVLSADLLLALSATTLASIAFFAGQVRYVRMRYDMPLIVADFELRLVGVLLRKCFPLAAAAFLLFYMGSAPKYAIDAMMDDAAQAYYGYISMPVFVVTIFAGFVYNPLITELTDQWLQGKVRLFLLRFAKIAAIIVGITLVCVTGAWAIGVPVLNILYNTDVSRYLAELLVLVAGGGFLAIATLATTGITIIRFQRVLVPLYLVISIVAYFVSNYAVAAQGVTGASWAYFGIMGVSALVFCGAFLVGSRLLSNQDELERP